MDDQYTKFINDDNTFLFTEYSSSIIDYLSIFLKDHYVLFTDYKTNPVDINKLYKQLFTYKMPKTKSIVNLNIEWDKRFYSSVIKLDKKRKTMENGLDDYENLDLLLDYYFETTLLKKLDYKNLDFKSILSNIKTLSTNSFKSYIFNRIDKVSVSSAIIKEFDSKNVFDFNVRYGDKYLASIGHMCESYFGYCNNIQYKESHDKIILNIKNLFGDNNYVISYDNFLTTPETSPNYDLVFSTLEPIIDIIKYAKEYLLLNVVKAWQNYLNIGGYMVLNGIEDKYIEYVILLVLTYCLNSKFETIIYTNEEPNIVFYKDVKTKNTDLYIEILNKKYKFTGI
jgi:hypothetical protein